MALRGGTEHPDRGAVIISMLIATLVGAVLAVGGSIAIVKAQNDQNVETVKKPLVTYDQR